MYDKVILVQEEPRGPSQLIEVSVTATGQSRIKFPDVQQLRNQVDQKVLIKALRLITLDVLTNGVVTGLPNATLAELQKISLIIYCEGWEKAQYWPILTINDVGTPGGTFPHRYHNSRVNNWQNVDWSKTFLIYSSGTTSNIGEGNGYVVMIDVEYEKLDTQGNVIIGPS
jgi:hypothetical protein